MSSDPSGRQRSRRIAPSSVRVRALHPAPQPHRHPVHGFGPRHDARGYPMRDERFEVTVTFDWRLGAVAVPVVRPPASRNVVVPLLSRVAVPVVRPPASRNVLVPLLSVVTVPVVRPLALRNVVWF